MGESYSATNRQRWRYVTGMIASTVSGLVFGTLYVTSGGNLWPPSMLAHGLTDTLALALTATGTVAI